MKEPSEKLKAKWYKKLEKYSELDPEDPNYFEDIENADGSLKPEVDYRSMDTTRGDILHDGRQEYYSVAQDYLNRGKFATLLDYTVWKMHSEGTSYRDIASELNLTFYKVGNIVKRVRKLAGVKK